MRISRRKFLALAAAGAAGGVAAEWARDVWSIEVNRVKAGLGLGLTLLVASDLHIHSWGPAEEAVRSALSEASEEADVLVFLGDGYDSFTPSLELLHRVFEGVKVPKLGVLGNHEHWAAGKFPLNDGLEAYARAGVRVLVNEKVELHGMVIGGVDWFHDEKAIAESYLREVGEVDVLLSHTPDVVLARPRAKLVLAGHTHGGQVCLPLVGPLWVPSKLGRKYASGFFEYGGTMLYVSRGLGESVVPVRLGCPRELVLVEV